VRLGLVAYYLAARQPQQVLCRLHGSLAATGAGHATDLGLTAGLLGWAPDDDRLAQARTMAAAQNVKVNFVTADLGENVHPNSVEIVVEEPATFRVSLLGSSVGGGSIEITVVDGLNTLLTGRSETVVLWHQDQPGFLARLTFVLAGLDINIATIRTSRPHRGAVALTVVELDEPLPSEAARALASLDHLQKLRVLPSLVAT
jgi:L-serine dehydratase